jgi:hypothetical protein
MARTWFKSASFSNPFHQLSRVRRPPGTDLNDTRAVGLNSDRSLHSRGSGLGKGTASELRLTVAASLKVKGVPQHH